MSIKQQHSTVRPDPLWMILIAAGVFLQLVLAGYIIWASVGHQSAPVPVPTAGASTDAAQAGRKSEADSLAFVYKRKLLFDKEIDASQWHARPDLFACLKQRKVKDVTDFEAARTCDAQLITRYLQGLPLKRLLLNDTQITGSALKALATFPSLAVLQINGIKCKPEDLSAIARLDNLVELSAKDCGLNDQCVKVLVSNHLRQLILDKNQAISNAAIVTLVKANAPLTLLGLGETSIDDAAAKDLAKLRGLKELWLWKTKVTDRALGDLAHCPALTSLDLSYTTVSDSGLKTFKPAGLKTLVLKRCTAITPAGIAAFHKAVPGCYLVTELK